jgi:hypothetical protein
MCCARSSGDGSKCSFEGGEI